MTGWVAEVSHCPKVHCRYKKAFQEHGVPTAAIKHYRALIDCAIWCASLRKGS